MRNIVIAYVDRFLHDRRERLRFGGVVLLLAVIVVGVVFWRLSMTGIAMTNEVNCGLEEHQHDNSCYTEVLTCGLEESAGSEGHTHDSTCYETVTELVCGLEESEGHIHDDSCFDEYGNLTCAIPESEGHAHTDACYETTQVLICGLEEEPATAGHTHDSSCYELVLTCTIPEHVHTIECMTDETADVETAEDWEATLPEDDELTGLWNEDVIAVAQSQLGYTESEANFRLAEDGETRQGYTRYGAWYGNEYGDWDGMFAAFCLEYAGVEDMPVSAGAYAWVVALEYEGLYADAEEYAPNPGELIFLNTDDDDKADTVAIVTGVDEEKGELTVIQGDSNDAVEEYTLNSNDDSIVGYGILPEQPEEEIAGTGDEDLPSASEEDAAAAAEEPAGGLEEVDVSDASAEPAEEEEEAVASGEASEEAEEELIALIFEGEDYIVTVSFGPEAGVPESAELIVREYASDSEEYLARLEEAAELYGWDREELPEGVRLFNIGLYVTDEETGESVEIEPDEPVEVVITYLDQEEENSYAVTHFGDEEPEELETVAEYEDGVQTVAFDLDNFSDVLVVPLAETSGEVVLNLGNGDGIYNFADYTGSNSEGAMLRYTTGSLTNYADDDGYVTINLPSDSDLGAAFTVVSADDDSGAVTVTLGKEAAYNYELVGWVNIATGEYYDVSDGAATADINLNNENVFYADWIGADYSQYDSSTSGSLRTGVVDTSSFVTIEMFDYNELFNLYSASVEQNGTDSESWSDSETLNSTLLGKGSGNARVTNSFVFTNDGTLSKAGALGYLSGRTDANKWTNTPTDASKSYVINSKEAWDITSPNSDLFDLLFSSENANDVVGVNYVGEANYLFWIDDNGYYTYDSEESAAVYDQGNERFYVYDSPQNITRGTGSNVKQVSSFLPYNSYSSDGSTYSVYNGTVDYWFGMKMTVDFYLPSATGTEGGNQLNGEDMVFYFSGDDDIWIFVDDELVLDMSGIHDRSYGSIDFSTGEVTIGMSRGSDGEIDITYGGTSTISLNSGNHTMTVYYMERGGWESNLEIQFNMVPLWEYETGPVQTVTAEKTWLDSQGNEIDPEDLPESYGTNGVEVGLFDVLGPASEGVFGYTVNDGIYTVEYTDDSGVTRTYVYDSSGPSPSLTYTEVTSNGTSTNKYDGVDSEGRMIDEDGYVIAWLDDDSSGLHLRMDVQTLNSDNGWYYAWELLDADGKYEVLELSSGSAYTTTSKSEDLTSYLYWSVIGDKEIENVENSMLDGDHPVILTEAAQEAEATLGDTQEAMGYVIVANVTNGETETPQMEVTTEQVKFSQIATLEKVVDGTTGMVTSYLGTYGVTSQSEIDALGDRALWYMVDSGNEDDDASGGTVEGFYLHCELNGTNYYLALGSDGHSLVLTLTETAESEFFYDSLGELMIEIRNENGEEADRVRVEILEDGSINIGKGEEEAATDDVRIYTLQNTVTSGFTFTAVNTFLPDITIQKVDSVTGESMSDVSFTLQNMENGTYYAEENEDANGDGGSDEEDAEGSAYEIVWVSGNGDGSVPNEAVQVTGEDGTIVFRYIPDGTYILTEVSTRGEYKSLPAGIVIVVENGEIQSKTVKDEESGEEKTVYSVSWSDDGITENIGEFVIVSEENGITITIKNIPILSSELPSTGGVGTTVFAAVGVVLVAAAGAAITVRSKKRVKGG